MTCVICKHGRTRPGMTTVTLQRDSCTVIFKEVPADLCENCGEYYLSSKVSKALFKRAQAAARNGAEVVIQQYAA